jgi:hypothetical protein
LEFPEPQRAYIRLVMIICPLHGTEIADERVHAPYRQFAADLSTRI